MVASLENSIPDTKWKNMAFTQIHAKQAKMTFQNRLQNYQTEEKFPLTELDQFGAFWD